MNRQREETQDAPAQQELRTNSWHAMAPGEVLAELGAGPEGLRAEDAARRLEEHGPNQLPGKEKESSLGRFLRQLHNTLIYVLLASAVLTALLREWVDMGVILGVVVINAVIGFLQEGKAEAAMESIRRMLSAKALAVRDGEPREIDAAQLVPGDLVVLKSGDRVPADMRVIEARNAQADESALTGESVPVSKLPEEVEADAPLGDRVCMVYSGTLLTSGRLRGVVTATGGRTELGRIGEMIAGVEEIKTPFLRAVDRFGGWLSAAILLVSAGAFLYGWLVRGLPLGELALAVVSLAVAAIPEGLPAIMTITLALGVQRMAAHNAIIRRLPAVETLGSVTVICSDKTGTLTRNEMTVRHAAAAGKVYSVEGSGYRPEGGFTHEGGRADPAADPALTELLRAALLATNARLHRDGGTGEWTIEGAPTEGAMVVLAAKAGLERSREFEAHPRLDELPFESEHRFMASLNRSPAGESVIHMNGAPEKVLEKALRQRGERGDEDLGRAWWERVSAGFASSGHRVIAVAVKQHPRGADRIDRAAMEGGFTLLGMLALMDPPREEAKAAIAECATAGIRVKMITGDHALTARSIGAQLGIGDGGYAVTGRELEHASDDELVPLVAENDVFARSSPEHKLRIVKALQRSGQVVAMTGDGVNDAPALKRADIGVAMGIKGSEATKEAAAMVLADDNFATIEQAVREGRTIYDNLKKTILFLLPTNGGQALVVLASIFLLFDVLPITPVQILWVNMVTAVTLALALAFEPAEPGIMRRPPRRPGEPVVDRGYVWRIVFVSALLAAGAIYQFDRAQAAGMEIALARTIAVNTLVAGEVFYLFNSRFTVASSFSVRALTGNPYVPLTAGVLVILQLAFTYLPLFHRVFGARPVPLAEWPGILAFGALLFALVELEKLVLRLRSRAPAPRPDRL